MGVYISGSNERPTFMNQIPSTLSIMNNSKCQTGAFAVMHVQIGCAASIYNVGPITSMVRGSSHGEGRCKR